MRISVVIPAFNEERLLGETLRRVKVALTVFLHRQWECEMIVCDNNSTDRTTELARQAGARVVFEPINQIARARNAGAAAATGAWLIFVDADTHPSAELFEDVAKQLASGDCLAGGSTVQLEGHHPKANLVTGLWNGVSRLFRWPAGSFIFCETRAFRQIGGFSHDLYASEEIHLGRRLKTLARAERRRIVILHRHPVVTSARKLHLYSAREHLWFLTKLVWSGGRLLSDRQACHTWYDGRR